MYPENERLIKACREVISRGNAKSFADIAKSCLKSPQYFTDIKAGRSKVSRIFLECIAEKYGVSEKFVLLGEGKIFDKAQDKGLSATEDESLKNTEHSYIDALEQHIKKLMELKDSISNELTKKDQEINRLNIIVNHLTDSLKNRSEDSGNKQTA